MKPTEQMSSIEPYVLLRAALSMFEKTPEQLDEQQLSTLKAHAQKEQAIETLILGSPEAARVVVTDNEVAKALSEIQSRFEDEEGFGAELARNHLTIETLTEALKRQCKVENVMELVGSRAATMSEVEAGIYYYMHLEKFRREEHRKAKHILVTINEDQPENTRKKALERINLVARKLRSNPKQFAKLALRYSECPTALEEGVLGSVPPGRLYPELDKALFTMQAGQTSSVIETEVGFHLLHCAEIHPPQEMPLEEAEPKIIAHMKERSKRMCQRQWLAELSAKN